jgi:hypothetical protein
MVVLEKRLAGKFGFTHDSGENHDRRGPSCLSSGTLAASAPKFTVSVAGCVAQALSGRYPENSAR